VIDIRQYFWPFSFSWCGRVARFPPAPVVGR
jgi:hypothetical protein